MPDDVAEEKVKALLALGAQVERVRPASIVDKKQACIFQIFGDTNADKFEQFVVGLLIITIEPFPTHDGNVQNLARERAKNFGSESGNSATSSSAHRGHLIPTASSSVIVTTTADEALADNALMSPKEEREFALKPRGFFADQFEVCPVFGDRACL